MPTSATHFEIPDETIKAWQEIVDLIAEIAEVPAALIMRLSDPEIGVLVANGTAENPYHPGESEHLWGSGLYCETVIKTRQELHVPNALSDEKWRSNPDVKLNMIAYLGLPILHPDGTPFGTICVLDRRENHFSETIKKLLLKFRNLVQANLVSVFFNHVLGEKNKKLSDYLQELQELRGIVQICSSCKSLKGGEGQWHAVEHYLIRHPSAMFSHGICPVCMERLYPGYDTGQEASAPES